MSASFGTFSSAQRGAINTDNRGCLEPEARTPIGYSGWRWLQCTDIRDEYRVLLPPVIARCYARLLDVEEQELQKSGSADCNLRRVATYRQAKDRLIKRCCKLSNFRPYPGYGTFTKQSLVAPPDFTLRQLERWERDRRLFGSAEPLKHHTPIVTEPNDTESQLPSPTFAPDTTSIKTPTINTDTQTLSPSAPLQPAAGDKHLNHGTPEPASSADRGSVAASCCHSGCVHIVLRCPQHFPVECCQSGARCSVDHGVPSVPHVVADAPPAPSQTILQDQKAAAGYKCCNTLATPASRTIPGDGIPHDTASHVHQASTSVLTTGSGPVECCHNGARCSVDHGVPSVPCVVVDAPPASSQRILSDQKAAAGGKCCNHPETPASRTIPSDGSLHDTASHVHQASTSVLTPNIDPVECCHTRCSVDHGVPSVPHVVTDTPPASSQTILPDQKAVAGSKCHNTPETPASSRMIPSDGILHDTASHVHQASTSVLTTNNNAVNTAAINEPALHNSPPAPLMLQLLTPEPEGVLMTQKPLPPSPLRDGSFASSTRRDASDGAAAHSDRVISSSARKVQAAEKTNGMERSRPELRGVQSLTESHSGVISDGNKNGKGVNGQIAHNYELRRLAVTSAGREVSMTATTEESAPAWMTGASTTATFTDIQGPQIRHGHSPGTYTESSIEEDFPKTPDTSNKTLGNILRQDTSLAEMVGGKAVRFNDRLPTNQQMQTQAATSSGRAHQSGIFSSISKVFSNSVKRRLQGRKPVTRKPVPRDWGTFSTPGDSPAPENGMYWAQQGNTLHVPRRNY